MKMDQKRIRKRTLLLIAFSSFVAAAGSMVVVSLAKYNTIKEVGQPATRGEKPPLLLYLEPSIWSKGVDSSGVVVDPNYYLYSIVDGSSGHLVSPSMHITTTVASKEVDFYVFEYEQSWVSSSLNFLFIRANPSQPITNFDAFPSYTGDNRVVWNQTQDINFATKVATNGTNYFQINGWNNDNNKSGYTEKKLVKNLATSTLSWG